MKKGIKMLIKNRNKALRHRKIELRMYSNNRL